MANIGIITEFNPFHSGHRWLIDNVKQENDTVICVMSGHFVQRGDVAITDKAARTAAALKNGADLVIELPLPFALSSAQFFAEGGVALLKSLGIIDTLCFGSECGDIKKLFRVADLLQSTEFEEKLSATVKSGDTYAKLRTEILGELDSDSAELLKSPNNILGVEYILASRRLGLNANIKTVARTGAAHDSNTADATASASYIRELIKSGQAVPPEYLCAQPALDNPADISRLEGAILASLRADNSPERFAALPDISEGLENRIVEAVKAAATLEQLYEGIKSKRYTLARIRRIIMCAFLGITDKWQKTAPPYIRVLGFNERGQAALSKISQASTLPIITTAAEIKQLTGDAAELFALECRATDLWALSLKNPQKCGNEYFYKIVKE